MEKNQMSLEFSALSQNESFARVAVGSFFVQLNPTLEELADVKTAVSEAVTNCIVHAYGEQGGAIRIECAMDGDTMEIRIVDYGVGHRRCGEGHAAFLYQPAGRGAFRDGLYGDAVLYGWTHSKEPIRPGHNGVHGKEGGVRGGPGSGRSCR